MDITDADRIDEQDIERVTVTNTASVEFSGMSAFDGTTSPLVYSRAPGIIGKTYGAISSYDNYIVTDQDEAHNLSDCT